jgi:hypothetical protein
MELNPAMRCDAMRCDRASARVGGNLQPKPTPTVPTTRTTLHTVRIFSATAAARMPPNPTHAGSSVNAYPLLPSLLARKAEEDMPHASA